MNTKDLRQGTLIDKLELKNLSIVSIKDMQELYDRELLTNWSSPGREIMNRYITESGQCFSNLRIKKDKWIHLLKAGKGVNGQYCNLQTGIYDQEVGNLNCNSVIDYRKQIDKIKNQLEKEYGIVVDFSESQITSIELNRTFKIDYPFDQYSRVLKLILAEMPRMNTVSFFGSTTNKVNQINTYSAWTKQKSKSKQYKQITIYDKSKQLNITIYDDLMRVELKIVGKKNIEKAFKTTRFYDLTEKSINEYFSEQMTKLIVKPIEKWKVERNKLLLRLMNQEREKEPNNWQVNVLRKLMNAEIEKDKPILLDITELCDQVDRVKGLKRKDRVKRNFRHQATKYESVFLNNDDIKLQEVIDKLLATDEATTEIRYDKCVALF